MIAALDLKSGKRDDAFFDFNATLKCFEYGVSFLLSDSWTTQYNPIVNLFDVADEDGK